MSVRRYKGPKDKCDVLFSKIIRSIGECEHCGRKGTPGKTPGSWSGPNPLQCAHIRSRRYNNTRCIEINAVCLCASCHYEFGLNPAAFIRWVDEQYGPERNDEILRLSNDTSKVWRERDWEELHITLKNRWDEIRGSL